MTYDNRILFGHVRVAARTGPTGSIIKGLAGFEAHRLLVVDMALWIYQPMDPNVFEEWLTFRLFAFE